MELFAALTDTSISLIITNVVVLAGIIIKMGFDMWSRIQDREDRKQLAAFTAEGLAAVKAAGGEREVRLVAEIEATRKVVLDGIEETKKFAEVANGVNAKIASLGIEANALKQQVQEVHVTNTDPIPVVSLEH